MNVVADTSVWIEYLRRGADSEAADLKRLLDADALCVCGPVAAELVAGAGRDDAEELWRVLEALPWADLDRPAWRRVGEVARSLRQAGETVPLTDVSLAVACVSAGAALWTRDGHFGRVRKALPALELYEPSEASPTTQPGP